MSRSLSIATRGRIGPGVPLVTSGYIVPLEITITTGGRSGYKKKEKNVVEKVIKLALYIENDKIVKVEKIKNNIKINASNINNNILEIRDPIKIKIWQK
jgi:hypothetical protein